MADFSPRNQFSAPSPNGGQPAALQTAEQNGGRANWPPVKNPPKLGPNDVMRRGL